jgi:nitrous oxide reductase accessory protein NosL
VPFGDLTAAKRFVEERGGSILAFDEIPQEMVLGPADEGGSETSATGGGSHERTQ